MQKKNILLIIFLGVVIYFNSLGNHFQFDDTRLLKGIKNISSISQVFSLSPSGRMVSNLTFYLNYSLGGTDIYDWHLVNLTIHILTAILIYWIVFLLVRHDYSDKRPDYSDKRPDYSDETADYTDKTADYTDKRTQITATSHLPPPTSHLPPPASHLPLFTALLFLVHPLSTEPVNYIIARYSLLATMFSFLSLFFFILYLPPSPFPLPQRGEGGGEGTSPVEGEGKRMRGKKIYLLGTVLSVLLAMYSKEVGLFYALCMITVYGYVFHFRLKVSVFKWKRVMVLILIFVFLGLLAWYFGYEKGLFGNLKIRILATTQFVGLKYFLTENMVFLKYLRLMFFPVGLNVDHHIQWVRGDEIHDYLPLVLNLAVLGIAFYLKSREKAGYKLFSFILFWLVLLHLPYLFLTSLELMVEYRTYPLIFGYSLLLTWAIASIKKKKIREVIFLSAVVIFSGLTFLRNRVWRNGFTLWADTVKKSPKKARPYNNLGLVYFSMNRRDLAKEAFEKALDLDQHAVEVYNNLGAVYTAEGRYEEAISLYEKALRFDRNQPQIYHNLGLMFREQKKYGLAIDNFRKAIEFAPQSAVTHYFLALTYVDRGERSKGDYDEAIKELEITLKLGYNPALVHNSLGIVYDLKGWYEQAIAEYEEAIKIEPNYVQAYYNSGITYEKKKLFSEAVAKYKKAIELKPDYAQAYNNLGNVYYKQGRYEEAIAEYEKALGINPNFVEAKNNFEEVRKKME